MSAFTFSGGSTTRLVPVELAVSANHTIKSVNGDPRPWEYPKGSGNWNEGYKLTLEDGTEVEHSIKMGKSAPRPGDVIFGYIEESNDPRFLPKLKKPKGAPGGGGNWSRKDDPDQRRSIERQVSAKIAADLVIAGVVKLEQFRDLTDRVHKAIEGQS